MASFSGFRTDSKEKNQQNCTISVIVSDGQGSSQSASYSQGVKKTGSSVCNYSTSPSSQSFGSNAGTGSVQVTAPSGCGWVAGSNASWITITSGSSGSGNGTVNYSVAANTGASSRTGTLTVAWQTFTVTQAGLAGITPNGGENWPVGSTQTIQWNSSGVSGNVKVELSRDGGTIWASLFSNTANDGGEIWTVTGPVTTQAKIRVSSVNDLNVIGTSNANFQISDTSITVTIPNGGETWVVGSARTIQWTSTGISENVKIELSRDGGAVWTTLFSSTANDGSESWKVTKPVTTQARIRVSSINSPSITDISNANFTIQK